MANIITVPNLGTSFDLGTITPNKIEIKVDNTSIVKGGTGELSANPSTMTWDNTTKIITHTSGTGVVTNIDLSDFTTDIYVNGGSFNPATSIITLTDSDGTTPDVTIDLSSLLGVSTDANNALTNGADGKPYLSNDAFGVSTDAGQLLINGTDSKALFTKTELDGVTTIHQDAFGVDILRGVNL